jgi:hypothetical protein
MVKQFAKYQTNICKERDQKQNKNKNKTKKKKTKQTNKQIKKNK